MKTKTYLHFLFHSLRLRFVPSHRVPLTVNIQLLLRCNNDCVYCGHDVNDPTRLPIDVLRRVFQEAWEIGTRRIHLTGGEPMLRDDLADIVGYAKNRGFFVSIATNGTLAKERLDVLRQVDQVLLSFDGPFEIRERLCGLQSARDSEKAVSLFKDHGIPFWTTTVLTRVNIPHIDWIVDHARRFGTQANFVLMSTHPGEGPIHHPEPEGLEEILPTDGEIRKALGRLIELKKQGAPIGSSLPFLEELVAWPDYRRPWSAMSSPRYRCVAWRSTCELQADGDLFSCDWAMQKLPGQSVLDQGFKEAFNHLPEIKECRSCPNSCFLESNLIFNLNPSAVVNWLRHIRQSHKWRQI